MSKYNFSYVVCVISCPGLTLANDMDADINYQYSVSMVHSTHTINLTLAQLPALEGVEQMLP